MSWPASCVSGSCLRAARSLFLFVISVWFSTRIRLVLLKVGDLGVTTRSLSVNEFIGDIVWFVATLREPYGDFVYSF